MSSIEVSYNGELDELESALTQVTRPGDYCVHGTLELPLPHIDVQRVGTLSWPLPKAQAQALIAIAERAPYGRGTQTLIDPEVRNAWQIGAAQLSIGGKSWPRTLAAVLDAARLGLGCADAEVHAEFYKLLAYEPGGFFIPHRDSEKAAGMFATLVIVLPCDHQGGELVIRHAGRERSIDLASTEFGEISFAAFYADCEHEVLPIRSGYRISLIYNLIHGGHSAALTAPDYAVETQRTGVLLRDAFTHHHSPRKLVWLLEHHYSAAELSFGALKGADVARAVVLREASTQAHCVAYLAMVHIAETGSAEIHYEPRSRGQRRPYYEEEDDVDSSEFDVIDVCDRVCTLDHWLDFTDRAMEFGSIALTEGELLPAGALDNEEPDEQRLTEATGNEGASFERAYHRAAVVLWPRDRLMPVLLQGGLVKPVELFGQCILAQAEGAAVAPADLATMAGAIVEHWTLLREYNRPHGAAGTELRSSMLDSLAQFGDPTLLARFLADVVIHDFTGGESAALVAAALVLDADRLQQLFGALLHQHSLSSPRACIGLIAALVDGHAPSASTQRAALRALAQIMVAALPCLALPVAQRNGGNWRRAVETPAMDAYSTASLLQLLAALNLDAERARVIDLMIALPAVFEVNRVVVPALAALATAAPYGSTDPEYLRLWGHAAAHLLDRSEHAPQPPGDWRQQVSINCVCEDCRALQRFAVDPHAQIHRFRVRKERRQHLHGQIGALALDMTHITERIGSPQTLVCTKTHGHFERACRQYAEDRTAMATLLRLATTDGQTALAAWSERLRAALAPKW